MRKLKLAWYGDDFTGSTDVMETLALGGFRAALFLAPPTTDFLRARFPDVEAIGVAGISRALPTDQLEKELDPVFAALAEIDSPIFHYKTCSTFDSSPEIGSIGRTVELALRHFPATWVPLVVGAPRLGRFVAFANLFAGFGPQVFRIDRHPAMRAHPVTPMQEADLRLHLAKQTNLPIGHVDLTHFGERLSTSVDHARKGIGEAATPIVLFDCCSEEHLKQIGELLWKSSERQFIVGSSGVEHGFVSYLQHTGCIPPRKPVTTFTEADRVLVMSGSAAPQTAAQIRHAEEHGFVAIRITVNNLLSSESAKAEMQKVGAATEDNLANGRSVVIYSASGPEDRSIVDGSPHIRNLLGKWQGELLKNALRRTGVRRVCVAGGDTSGMVSRQLRISALEMVLPIAPGAPLCKAHADDLAIDGLEVALKGGQNGGVSYFEQVRKGQTETQYKEHLLFHDSGVGQTKD
ncbi:MAG: four-carbon acid sugar kinase family protein [Verrucomicrobia bacterium]|nr:four-carbon acid sugar kinase family protein [Verrucomicrobiota bacterium]